MTITRTMGDATHANAPALAAIAGSLQLVAGYDTGTPDIQWTAADWARFPGLTQIHIDQGFASTPATEAHAIAFDVEPLAWAPSQAAELINQNTSPRPTIYVNRANLAATVASALTSPRWHGDIWLAFPAWQPGQPLPELPAGCRYVAVQNQLAAAYDLSAVLDPNWPEEAPMIGIHNGWAYCVKCAGMFFTNGQPANGTCPAGGQHETHTDAGFPYAIPYSS